MARAKLKKIKLETSSELEAPKVKNPIDMPHLASLQTPML